MGCLDVGLFASDCSSLLKFADLGNKTARLFLNEFASAVEVSQQAYDKYHYIDPACFVWVVVSYKCVRSLADVDTNLLDPFRISSHQRLR